MGPNTQVVAMIMSALLNKCKGYWCMFLITGSALILVVSSMATTYASFETTTLLTSIKSEIRDNSSNLKILGDQVKLIATANDLTNDTQDKKIEVIEKRLNKQEERNDQQDKQIKENADKIKAIKENQET